MTRIVVIFFSAVAFLMTVYWVVPGANPPPMVAVQQPRANPPQTVVLLPPAASTAEPAPALPAPAPMAAAAAPSPVASPAVASAASSAATVARVSARSGGCAGDPIRCMLEGKGIADDPTDVTGSIVTPAHRPAAAPRTAKVVR